MSIKVGLGILCVGLFLANEAGGMTVGVMRGVIAAAERVQNVTAYGAVCSS